MRIPRSTHRCHADSKASVGINSCREQYPTPLSKVNQRRGQTWPPSYGAPQDGGDRSWLIVDSHRFGYGSDVCQLWDLDQIMSTLDLSFSIFNMRVIIAWVSQGCCEDPLCTRRSAWHIIGPSVSLVCSYYCHMQLASLLCLGRVTIPRMLRSLSGER